MESVKAPTYEEYMKSIQPLIDAQKEREKYTGDFNCVKINKEGHEAIVLGGFATLQDVQQWFWKGVWYESQNQLGEVFMITEDWCPFPKDPRRYPKKQQ